MGGGFKRKSGYKSDHFVASDDDDDRPTKRGKGISSAKKVHHDSKETLIDDDGNKYWELSDKRRVTLSEFNKNTLVNIREYYEKDGKSLPGKKGISLTVEQFSSLLGFIPQIEESLMKQGHHVPRPDYSGSKSVKSDAKLDNADDEQEEDSMKKANIEATSDEDE